MIKKIVYSITWVVLLVGFAWTLLSLIHSDKCDICGTPIGEGRQRAEWWLCDNCASRVGREARIRQGIPYSIEKHGYIETTHETRDYELEIIKEMLDK